MMMRMLNKGGMELLTDQVRKPDRDNPCGYYEYEPVKRTIAYPSWIADARGKAVKVIYRFVQDLPNSFEYRVILMHRKIEEVIASQKKMLKRRGQEGAGIPDEILARAFREKMEALGKWIDQQSNITRLDTPYNEILTDPLPFCRRLDTFLGNRLDVLQMAQVIDTGLYRNRL